MKKLIAAASALALTAGLAFGETHETLKAHTLSTSVGDISFGAWGRSTFNVGRQNTSTKITVDPTSLAKAAEQSALSDIYAYEAAKDNGSLAAVNGAVQTLAPSAPAAGNVTRAADNSNIGEYGAAVATYAGYKAAYDAYANGETDVNKLLGTAAAVGAATGENITNYVTKEALMSKLAGLETDESSSRNYASLAPDWSYGCRVGFWIIGRTPDEHFGFDFNLDADGRALFVHKLWNADEGDADVNYNEDGKYAVAIGDQAKIWGLFDNPLFQTKVAFGRMREQELRGTIGDFGQRESSEVKSEDDIFQEIWTATGLFASVKGNEDSVLKGFYLNGAIDMAGTLGTYSDPDGNTVKLESASDKHSDKAIPLYQAVRDAQIGVGYTVPGLLQVKAQYWGDSISEYNFRYENSKYYAARKAGYGMNDYYGRMEFGIDWLGFMGGATSFLDPNLNLEETPNANLIELGFKVPIVTSEGLRDYDPEKFYNWYSCLGTMGVIEKGFIMYKGHLWGGMGTSNLGNYTKIGNSGSGLITMDKGDGANIVMTGFDFLTEVCINPFGKQDVFVGLSGNYNITYASASGQMTAMGASLSVDDLKLKKHKIGAELYVKKTFAANNFMFAGIAADFTIQSMEGTVQKLVDLSYENKASRFYMPIGVEMFF